MPRDVHGKAVKSEAAEPVKYGPATDSKEKERKAMEPHAARLEEHEERLNEHDGKLKEHHDRMNEISEHLGLAKKADAYKAEDQGGKGKIGAGHVTEKPGASYGRKRH